MKAITYDDILMVPSYNHWESRKVVDIKMRCKMGKLDFIEITPAARTESMPHRLE
jgi:IMP dehydrogenase/GMP reductase